MINKIIFSERNRQSENFSSYIRVFLSAPLMVYVGYWWLYLFV